MSLAFTDLLVTKVAMWGKKSSEFEHFSNMKNNQKGNTNSDLLVNQADIRPFPQAVVQVAQRVSRQIPSGQDERVGWDRRQDLSAKLLDHTVSALVALTEIIRTDPSAINMQLKRKNNAHWGK